MALPSFTLYPSATVANAPFALGHAFKQGDVPVGSQVVAPFADFQCTPKNVWPDGSLKFAVLAGRANVSGTTPLSVQLSIGTPSTGTNIAASSISAVVTIDCGTFGAVTFSGSDWATPFDTWVSGPKMSWFRYRKPVASDPHLVVWIEARVWSGGEVEIFAPLENGYFFKAAPTNKSATFSLTLGGTQRVSTAIDLKHHQRTPLLTGAALAYWLGADPGVTPFPDPAYLQATELVPSYNSLAAGSTSALGSLLPTTYTPLQQGGFNYSSDVMSGTGYQPAIGLLPTHDAAYFTCNDNPVLRYQSVVRNGFSAGRYGIHFRDETTNYPPKYSAYKTAGLWPGGSIKNAGDVNGAVTPAATGGEAPQYDPAHCPSMGYLAYLLTGRPYFMEEAQFNAIVTHFCYTDWVRAGGRDGVAYTGADGASGICVGFPEMRTAAWSFRNLVQACSATPDGHPLQVEFVHSVEENCRFFNAKYSGQSSNLFGMIAGGEGDYGALSTAATHPQFMNYFVTGAWGYALALNLPISTTAKSQMSTFFTWKAKGVIGTLGDSNDFWYVNGAPFIIPSSPDKTTNYNKIEDGTATWFATYKQAYDVLVGQLPPNYGTPYSTTEGVLRYEEASLRSRGVWGNLMPAIAYAARHNVTGAAEAIARVTSASNYNLFTSELSINPVWGVVPSGQTQTGGTLTTPGPSFRWDSAPIIANSFIWDTRYGLGAPLGEYATTGTDASSPIYAIKVSGDNPLSEVRTRYISTSSGFLSDGNGGYTTPIGAVNYEAYLDGPSLGQATDTFTSGTPDTTTPVMTGAISSSAITTSSFTLTWPAASDNIGVTGYEVSTNGGTSYVNAGNVLSVSKTGLTSSTAYPCRVRAYDAAGNKAIPLSLTVSTSAAADSTAPTMQGSLTISAITSGGFTVGWAAASDNVAVTGYELSTDNGATYVNVASVLSYACTGKSASTLYNVKVRAYDAAGNRSTPLSTTATTSASSDTTAPSFTGSLTVTNITTGGFTVTWPSATDGVGVAGYEISIDSGTPAYVGLGNVLSNTKTGLASATQFNVRVRAFDAAGNRSAALTTTVTIATPGTYATTVTVTFQDRNSTLKANLTGMKWAFFDQTTPDNLLAPSAKGTLATTNGSGVTVLNITGTQLPPGATGWLVFSNSDGTATQTNLVSFAGPCVVA